MSQLDHMFELTEKLLKDIQSVSVLFTSITVELKEMILSLKEIQKQNTPLSECFKREAETRNL